MAEPHIVINGQTLTVGQSMTVRCAIESFAMTLDEAENDEGTDDRALNKAYQARIAEIRAMYLTSKSHWVEEVVFPDQENWEGLGPTPSPATALGGAPISPMAQRLADLERLVLAITKLVPDAPLDTSAGHNIATILEMLKLRHPDV